ncbi:MULTISPECIES: DUF188 domain-containing protein [Exiguobacterium]|uniref:UPF0178 protein EXIGUO9Y_360032 n=1 Tax=Exiguobacterium oxidotolerans TaxID=223958 RepID=A0A653IF25_9BACL|nr:MULTISPECIES: DUF188 domain-containing protein [Exiguobacterium]ASI35094.1 hypothetical protein A0126_05765 [Exiguobacterium sp. N4-1P]VWX37751.1 conserved hypothetical protein [Exiguobacterium oxidotolerans]
MKVLVDADGCPVVDLTIRLSAGVDVFLVCDTAHEFNRAGATTITIGQGPDAVDYAIVNRISPGDIIVTQDYGLAALALARKGRPIDQNGRIFTDDNIDFLLHTRHVGQQIRRAGGRTKGPKKRTRLENEQFEVSFRSLLKQEEFK